MLDPYCLSSQATSDQILQSRFRIGLLVWFLSTYIKSELANQRSHRKQLHTLWESNRMSEFNPFVTFSFLVSNCFRPKMKIVDENEHKSSLFLRRFTRDQRGVPIVRCVQLSHYIFRAATHDYCFFFHVIIEVEMLAFAAKICGLPQRSSFVVHVAMVPIISIFSLRTIKRNILGKCMWAENKGKPTGKKWVCSRDCSQSSHKRAANTNEVVDSATSDEDERKIN